MMFRNNRIQNQQLSLTDMLAFPKKWDLYKKQFSKEYKDKDEDTIHKQIYFSRYAQMEENNKKVKENLVYFKINHTEFSDLTEEEIQAYYLKNPTEKANNFIAGKSPEEQWENFKKQMKKRFSSQSEEDIPKFFFFSKIKEVEGQVSNLKKIGLAVDLQHVNHYCDYDKKNSAKTFLDEILNEETPKGKKRRFEVFF